MARRHWQIIHRKRRDGGPGRGRDDAGGTGALRGVSTALRAANLIGNGLYGVDLKQVGRQCYVIEVNDNPSIDSGVEDKVLKGDLYSRVMSVFLRRIEQRKFAWVR